MAPPLPVLPALKQPAAALATDVKPSDAAEVEVPMVGFMMRAPLRLDKTLTAAYSKSAAKTKTKQTDIQTSMALMYETLGRVAVL